MSISGLTTSYIPASLDGLNVIDADQIYIDGQLVNLTDYVPYQGANRTIDAGGQNIQTTHTATSTNDVVNKGLLDTTISNLAISIAGSFLDKVSVTPQIVIGNVSYTAQLSADDLLVPATKKATLGSVLSIDANYATTATDAGVITRQYFGSISSSMGIYEATSTQNFAILQCADLGTGTGKRMDINWNLNINETYNSSIQLFASSDGVTTNQYLGPSVSFTPSDPLYKVMTGTFVPQYRYLCVLCATSKPSGVQTVRWYGLDIDEQGVELTNVTMPSLTADRVAVFNGNKQLVSSGISTTTLGYIAHLSSDAQSQLNGKLNLSGSNANQNIVIGAYKVQSTATPSVDDDLTRKGYVDSGLALKASLAANQTFTGTNTFSSSLPIVLSGLTPSRVLQLSASAVVQASAVTITELGYVSGVTSAIQTQLNTLSGTFANYLPLTGGTLSGNLTVQGSSGVSLTNVATTNGFLATRFYIGARGDNQDDVGTDNKWGPWYGLGESGIPDFTGVPCLAGYAGVALRTSSGVLVMKDDGGVGIGTADINGRFNIAHLGGVDFLTLQNINDSAGQYIDQRFMFGKSGVSRDAYLTSVINANDETDFVFYVHGSGLNERLRIKGNGNIYANALVGIGESSPSAPLHVKASGGSNPATNGVYVHNTTNSAGQDAIVSVRVAGTAGGNPFVSFDVAGEIGWAWGMDNADNSMKLSNSWSSLTAATKMTIKTDGSFGLLCSPDYLMDINGTGRVRNSFYVGTEGNTSSQIYFGGVSGDAGYDHCVIESRSLGSGEKSEMLLFKGNDNSNGAGPDRIRLRAAEISFDTYSSATNNRTAENIRMRIAEDGVSFFTAGDNSYSRYGPNSTWSSYLHVGSTTNKVGQAETAQVITTNGNLHLDAGYGRDTYINYYSNSAGNVGNIYSYSSTNWYHSGKMNIRGNANTNASLNIMNPNGSYTHFGYSDGHNYIRGANTYIDTEAYFNTWLRITNNSTGIYWQNLGRGISTPEDQSNSYGSINTYGSGRNGWSGYGINSRWCFMSNGLENCGLHDNVNSWALQQKGTIGLFLNRIARASAAEFDRFIIWRVSEENYGGGYWYFNVNGGSGYTSDIRIKKDIAPLSTHQSIAFIKHLQPTTFRMKDTEPCVRINPDGSETIEEAKGCNCFLQDGFIAQNILEACNVTGVSKSVLNNWYGYEEEMKKPEEERKLDKDTILGVNDRPILCHTVNAVKGLMEEIDVLTQRNKILETWARDQEAKMAKMEANIEKMASLLAQLISKQ